NENVRDSITPYPQRSTRRLKKITVTPNPVRPKPVITPSSARVNPYSAPHAPSTAPRAENPIPEATRVRKLPMNNRRLLSGLIFAVLNRFIFADPKPARQAAKLFLQFSA